MDLESVIPGPLGVDCILIFAFKGFLQYHNICKKSYTLQLIKLKCTSPVWTTYKD